MKSENCSCDKSKPPKSDELNLMKLRQLNLIPRFGYVSANFAKKSRQCLSLGNDRKEISVVAPPRDDVLVKMPSDTGTRHFSLIHSNVEAMSSGDCPQHPHGLLSQLRYLSDLFGVCLVVGRYVTVWTDEHMSRVIRK